MKEIFKTALSSFLDRHISDLSVSSVSGGDINQAFKITLDQDVFFAKVNDAAAFPQMFEKERKGLELLAQTSFRIPKVFDVIEVESHSILLMEWIEQGPQPANFWETFGQHLAEMHRFSSEQFGLNHHNFIGSLPQMNNMHDDWIAFFNQERILPQLTMAIENGYLNSTDEASYQRLYLRLNEYFESEPPSLVHGDLWDGNYMCGKAGRPILIDPAIHFGHRMMDIGMTKLFGGFSNDMYDAYNEAHPLPKNWKDGVQVAQLYPLLVHVNLFGNAYVSQVRQVLSTFA